MELPRALLAHLGDHYGLITRSEAFALGCTRKELDRAVATGGLRNLWRGILTSAPAPVTAGGRNLELARAIAIAYDEALAISHESALLAHDLPTYGTDLARARLVRCNGGDSLRTAEVQICRSRPRLSPVLINGARVVPAAVGIVQVACEIGVDAGLVAADAAAHRGLIVVDDVVAASRAIGRCPGAARARGLADLIEPATESPGETLTRLIAHRGGVRLEPQAPITDRRGKVIARVDFLLAAERRIVEFDGKVKYGSSGDLYAEKQREDRLRALGYEVVRVVWGDLARPSEVLRRIERGNVPPAE
ncbi:PDDEXK family nuclease [Cumulibacter manganitolerans]|uniref:hypothetical protein n=1 Tax=Cumulibacter manganitolerans TaxID=1884992 RepID=UPI0012979555|nr:hypothetical protein [Cumulibacter manganitolerans]